MGLVRSIGFSKGRTRGNLNAAMFAEHPVFSAPYDDTVIWRYMDFAKYVDLLARQSLFFSRPDLLGDRWEGNYPQWVYDAGREAHAEYVRRIQSLNKNPHARLSTYDESKNDLHRLFCALMNVNCWCIGANESSLMWRRYVGAIGGIAVVSTVGRLKRSWRNESRDVHIGAIRYIDYSRESIPRDNRLWPFMHKRRIFSDERELRAAVWRITNVDHPRSGVRLDDLEPHDRGTYVVTDVPSLVSAVVVSPYSSPWFIETVRLVTDHYGLKVTIRASEEDLPAPVEQGRL